MPEEALLMSMSIIVVYLVVMAYLGVYAGKKGRLTAEDYFLAKGTVGLLPLMLSFAATWTSAWYFLSAAGYMYHHGLAYYCSFAFNVACGLMIYYVGKRIWLLGHEFGFMSQMDIITDYYGSTWVGYLVCILLLAFTLPHIMIQLIGTGIMFQYASFQVIPFWLGCLLGGLVVTFYIWYGGRRAEIYTDVVQGILLYGSLLAVGVGLAYAIAGGIPEAIAMMAEKEPKLLTLPGPSGFATYTWFFSYLIIVGFSAPFHPQMWFSFQAIKDVKLYRYIPLLYVFVQPPYIGSIMAGGLGRIINPGLKGAAADDIIPMMISQYFPAWFLGIIMAGALAAAMSTADSAMHSGSAMLTKDFYARYNPKATSEQLARFGRWMILVLFVIGYVLALTRPALISYFGAIATGGVFMFAPTLIGIFLWPRATKWGVAAGYIVGVVVLWIFSFAPPLGIMLHPYGIMSSLWGLGANFAVFFVVSLLTKPPPKETIERYKAVLDKA